MNKKHELHGEKILLSQAFSVLEMLSSCGFILLGNTIVFSSVLPSYTVYREQCILACSVFFSCMAYVNSMDLTQKILYNLYFTVVTRTGERGELSLRKIRHVSCPCFFQTINLNFFSKIPPLRLMQGMLPKHCPAQLLPHQGWWNG